MTKVMTLIFLAVFSLGLGAAGTTSANAENLTWLVKSKYPYQVSVVFYSRDRNYSWPGGTRVWILSDSRTHRYNLSCRRGEKICFGAWVRGNTRRYWGVGYRGRKGCRNCCYYCDGGTTRVQTLRY